MDRVQKLIAIVGAGPGISQAVAHKFGKEGYAIALIARNTERLKSLQNELFEAGTISRQAITKFLIKTIISLEISS